MVYTIDFVDLVRTWLDTSSYCYLFININDIKLSIRRFKFLKKPNGKYNEG